MKTKYYAWKNGKQSEEKQEWIELSPREFIELCNNNRNLKQECRRYFYQLPGLESGDTYLYLECTYEKYLESRAAKDNRTRKRKEKGSLTAEGKWLETVSLDSEFEDESGDTCTLHDMILDPDLRFEDRLIHSVDVLEALATLSSDEIEIIERLYLSEYAVSTRKLAKEMKLPVMTLNNRKKKILVKLKKSLVQSCFFPTNKKVRG